MIYTSYFAKIKSLPENIVPISICAKAPSWYIGKQYKKLAPKYDFFMRWKENHNNDDYIKCFEEQVTNLLKADQVILELYDLLPKEKKDIMEMCNCPPWQNPDIHICLICYEKPSDFCHRHLVANWLTENGFHTQEYKC